MNLNEYVLNPGNKAKANPKFVITVKHDEKKNHSPKTSSSGQKNSSISVLPTTSNWGSAFTSIITSTSSRKSSNSKGTDEGHQSKTIVALTEGRGQARCEVGIAVINISSPVLIICQISDTQNYINTLTKINIFNPTEIIFPNTFENFGGNRLITKVKEQFPNIKHCGIPRSVFNKLSGLDMLSQLCLPSLNGIVLVLRHRYYALAATSALLTYLQDNLYIYYGAGSLKVDYQESEGYALIDVATADRLELVCSAKPAQANKYSSLLGILNNCFTKIGTRMLRSWILQPLSSIKYIDNRLDCIDELMNNRQILSSIQILLQKLSNIDSILNLATLLPEDPQKCTIRQLNYILNFNRIIDLVNPLMEIISNLNQPFFKAMKRNLDDPSFVKIRKDVRETISENAAPSKGQFAMDERCNAIKPGINELLDVVRKIYCERVNDLKDYVDALAEKHNLAFSLGNNLKKGYHIVLTLNIHQRKNFKKSDLPEEFIEVQRCAMYFTMKTPELVNISTRIDDILEDILKISNLIVYNLVVSLKKHISLFFTLCENIAQLDVYQSLAKTSLENNYIRPEFKDYTEIKLGQHPLLNFLLPTKAIANTIFCSDDYNVHVITGPNGSGKSILIRQMMLLQIMAQIGSYVPAESAIFKPVNKFFARIYLDDNMEYNASSFVLEMTEIKYIMSTMTNDSLIIIDELCRSTSVEEGMALAIAILEKMSCFSSFIFVTTHFTTLAKLSLIYPHIKAWQMETIPIGDNPKTFKLDYKYSLVPGITNIGRYGVYIVRKIWPESIVRTVDNSLDQLEKQQRKSLFAPPDPKSIIKYHTECEIRQLKRQHILFVPRLREIIVQYQINLQNLNYNLKNLSVAKNASESKEVESLLNTQEYIVQQEKFESIFTPDFFRNNLDNESSNASVNSSFINLLHPVISLDEHPFQLPFNPSESFDRLSIISDFSETPRNIPIHFSNDEPPNTSHIMVKKHYDHYLSPVVKIVEGLNNTSISQSECSFTSDCARDKTRFIASEEAKFTSLPKSNTWRTCVPLSCSSLDVSTVINLSEEDFDEFNRRNNSAEYKDDDTLGEDHSSHFESFSYKEKGGLSNKSKENLNSEKRCLKDHKITKSDNEQCLKNKNRSVRALSVDIPNPSMTIHSKNTLDDKKQYMTKRTNYITRDTLPIKLMDKQSFKDQKLSVITTSGAVSNVGHSIHSETDDKKGFMFQKKNTVDYPQYNPAVYNKSSKVQIQSVTATNDDILNPIQPMDFETEIVNTRYFKDQKQYVVQDTQTAMKTVNKEGSKDQKQYVVQDTQTAMKTVDKEGSKDQKQSFIVNNNNTINPIDFIHSKTDTRYSKYQKQYVAKDARSNIETVDKQISKDQNQSVILKSNNLIHPIHAIHSETETIDTKYYKDQKQFVAKDTQFATKTVNEQISKDQQRYVITTSDDILNSINPIHFETELIDKRYPKDQKLCFNKDAQSAIKTVDEPISKDQKQSVIAKSNNLINPVQPICSETETIDTRYFKGHKQNVAKDTQFSTKTAIEQIPKDQQRSVIATSNDILNSINPIHFETETIDTCHPEDQKLCVVKDGQSAIKTVEQQSSKDQHRSIIATSDNIPYQIQPIHSKTKTDYTTCSKNEKQFVTEIFNRSKMDDKKSITSVNLSTETRSNQGDIPIIPDSKCNKPDNNLSQVLNEEKVLENRNSTESIFGNPDETEKEDSKSIHACNLSKKIIEVVDLNINMFSRVDHPLPTNILNFDKQIEQYPFEIDPHTELTNEHTSCNDYDVNQRVLGTPKNIYPESNSNHMDTLSITEIHEVKARESNLSTADEGSNYTKGQNNNYNEEESQKNKLSTQLDLAEKHIHKIEKSFLKPSSNKGRNLSPSNPYKNGEISSHIDQSFNVSDKNKINDNITDKIEESSEMNNISLCDSVFKSAKDQRISSGSGSDEEESRRNNLSTLHPKTDNHSHRIEQSVLENSIFGDSKMHDRSQNDTDFKNSTDQNIPSCINNNNQEDSQKTNSTYHYSKGEKKNHIIEQSLLETNIVSGSIMRNLSPSALNSKLIDNQNTRSCTINDDVNESKVHRSKQNLLETGITGSSKMRNFSPTNSDSKSIENEINLSHTCNNTEKEFQSSNQLQVEIHKSASKAGDISSKDPYRKSRTNQKVLARNRNNYDEKSKTKLYRKKFMVPRFKTTYAKNDKQTDSVLFDQDFKSHKYRSTSSNTNKTYADSDSHSVDPNKVQNFKTKQEIDKTETRICHVSKSSPRPTKDQIILSHKKNDYEQVPQEIITSISRNCIDDPCFKTTNNNELHHHKEQSLHETSIFSASKRLNLSPIDTDSKSAKSCYSNDYEQVAQTSIPRRFKDEVHNPKCEQLLHETSISSASKRRNLSPSDTDYESGNNDDHEQVPQANIRRILIDKKYEQSLHEINTSSVSKRRNFSPSNTYSKFIKDQTADSNENENSFKKFKDEINDHKREQFIHETSISSVSKRRNLSPSDPDTKANKDQSISSTKSNDYQVPRESITRECIDEIQHTIEQSLHEISTSSASKRRNLFPTDTYSKSTQNQSTPSRNINDYEQLPRESVTRKCISEIKHKIKRSIHETSISSASKRCNFSPFDTYSKSTKDQRISSRNSNNSEQVPQENITRKCIDEIRHKIEQSLHETSISSASKRRNLSPSTTYSKSTKDQSTPSRNCNDYEQVPQENSSRECIDEIQHKIEQSLHETSISSASKRRNLSPSSTYSKSTKDQSTPSLNSNDYEQVPQKNISRECIDEIQHKIEQSLHETSISSASKRRNLSPSTAYSKSTKDQSTPSRNINDYQQVPRESINKRCIDKMQHKIEQSPHETSISSASKRRNLSPTETYSKSTRDQSTPSLNSNDYEQVPQTSIFNEFAAKTDQFVLEINSPSFSKRRSLSPTVFNSKPINNEAVFLRSISNASQQCILDTYVNPKKRCFRKKFFPPKKLTAKQIKQEFQEQDRKLFEGTPTSLDLSKYLEQRFRRPSVKQIQSATCVGTFRKTAKGFEVLQPEPETKKDMKSSTNESIDMTIFSDKNANVFEQFINSRETDFRNFNFNKKEHDKTLFSFNKENENIFDYYLANSQTNISTQNSVVPLTPDGFYKQNKGDIENVMSKYLDPKPSTSFAKPNDRGRKGNIFENSNFSSDDLDL